MKFMGCLIDLLQDEKVQKRLAIVAGIIAIIVSVIWKLALLEVMYKTEKLKAVNIERGE